MKTPFMSMALLLTVCASGCRENTRLLFSETSPDQSKKVEIWWVTERNLEHKSDVIHVVLSDVSDPNDWVAREFFPKKHGSVQYHNMMKPNPAVSVTWGSGPFEAKVIDDVSQLILIEWPKQEFRPIVDIMEDLGMNDLEKLGRKPRVEPYDGGDLGEYLFSINWGDNAILILNKNPKLMFELCLSARSRAKDKNMGHHSALRDSDVTAILAIHSSIDDPFWEKYGNAEPVPMEDLYEFIDKIASPGYHKAEQADDGVRVK